MDDRSQRFSLTRLLLIQGSLMLLKLLPLGDVPGYYHQQLLPVFASRQYPSLGLEVNVMSRSIPEPVFDPPAAAGQQRFSECSLYFRQVIRMNLNQRVAPGQTLHGVPEHPGVGSIIPNS